MSKIDDQFPAYRIERVEDILDRFAIAALTGVVARDFSATDDRIAKRAYEIARAMIEERQRIRSDG